MTNTKCLIKTAVYLLSKKRDYFPHFHKIYNKNNNLEQSPSDIYKKSQHYNNIEDYGKHMT